MKIYRIKETKLREIAGKLKINDQLKGKDWDDVVGVE